MTCSFVAIAVFVAIVLTIIAFELKTINWKLEDIYMNVKELITGFDNLTNEIAAEQANTNGRTDAIIAALKATGGTLTAEEEADAAAVTVKQQAIIDTLKASGKNPEAPIPPIDIIPE